MVQMHAEMSRQAHPAVNIKVQGPVNVSELLPLELGRSRKSGETEWQTDSTPAGFNAEWIEALSQSTRDGWWEETCTDHFQQARELAQETFGAHVTVWQEGRSGGWLIVEGLSDPDGWTVDSHDQWDEFERQVKAIAADVPRGWLWNLFANVYELEQEEASEKDEDAGTDALLHRTLPMLERLGDFIGNGDIDAQREGSQGTRCDLILDIKRHLNRENS